MKYSILFIIDNLNVGGAQRQLVRLVQGLRSRGIDAEVISLGSPADTLVQSLESECVRCMDMRSVWRIQFSRNS